MFLNFSAPVLSIFVFQEYIVRVYRGPTKDNSWQVTKRYSDFEKIDSLLRITGIDLPLPPKKVFGNFDRDFIKERQNGLQVLS